MVNKTFHHIGFSFFLIVFYGGISLLPQVENSPPKVNIVRPADRSVFQWNSIVPYQIDIDDKEDGKSAYDEINKNEVLFIVNYFPDTLSARQYVLDSQSVFHPSLRLMTRSNCMNCHANKSKLIGPSYALIAERYSNDEQSVRLLASRMIEGSKGVWGDVPMPPHPDIDQSTAQQMVRWILDNGNRKDQSFFVGTEGSFKTRGEPAKNESGRYVLTAAYTDRGIENDSQSKKHSQHTVVLLSKQP